MSASKDRHRNRNRSTDSLIYHRAGWQCQMPECICPDGRRIDRSFRGTSEPWAPTIDHIIPLSEGGQDVLVNKRAAHRQCNEDGMLPSTIKPVVPGPALSNRLGELYPELAKLLNCLHLGDDVV
jgi:HNH endonuclease